MTENDKMILAIVAFGTAHAGTIVGVLIWGFKHVLKYNLLLKEFEAEKLKNEKNASDINKAHEKIRELQKYQPSDKSLFSR